VKSQYRPGRNRNRYHEFVSRWAKAIPGQSIGIMIHGAQGPRGSSAALKSHIDVGRARSCKSPYRKGGAAPGRHVNGREGGIKDYTNIIGTDSYSCPCKLHNVGTAWCVVNDGKLDGPFPRPLR
jgi:hypothetical protein